MLACRSYSRGRTVSTQGSPRSVHTPKLSRSFATQPRAKLSRFDEKEVDYNSLFNNLEKWRTAQPKSAPLTLAEKILYAHLDDPKQKVRT